MKQKELPRQKALYEIKKKAPGHSWERLEKNGMIKIVLTYKDFRGFRYVFKGGTSLDQEEALAIELLEATGKVI